MFAIEYYLNTEETCYLVMPAYRILVSHTFLFKKRRLMCTFFARANDTQMQVWIKKFPLLCYKHKFILPSRWSTLSKTLPAVNRSPFGGFERDFAFFPTFRTDDLIHLSRTMVVSAIVPISHISHSFSTVILRIRSKFTTYFSNGTPRIRRMQYTPCLLNLSQIYLVIRLLSNV